MNEQEPHCCDLEPLDYDYTLFLLIMPKCGQHLRQQNQHATNVFCDVFNMPDAGIIPGFFQFPVSVEFILTPVFSRSRRRWNV